MNNSNNPQFISREYAKAIFENAPANVNKEKLLTEMVNKGYVFEGYNDVKPEPAPEPNLFDRAKSKLQAIGDKQSATIQNSADLYKQGKQTLPEAVGQTLGASVNAAGEAFALPVNYLAGKALDVVGSVTPEPIKNAVGDIVSSVAQPVVDQYNNLSPRTQANLKGVTDTLSGVSNLATGAVAAKTTGDVIGSVINYAKDKAPIVLDPLSKKMAERQVTKQGQKAIDALTPNLENLTDKEYQTLLAQGKIEPRVGMSAPKYIVSQDEVQTAQKYSKLLQSKDPAKNVISLTDELATKDTQVGNFLKKNNGIFNKGELRNAISSKLNDITDLTVNEEALNKMKDKTINAFVDGLKTNNMESLWQARKQYDKAIEKAFTGSPTVTKEVKKAFRNAVQDFIAERTPEGIYKGYMKEMSSLFNVRDVLLDKASTEKGLNTIRAWIKVNPNKAKALGYLGSLAGVAGVGSKLLND